MAGSYAQRQDSTWPIMSEPSRFLVWVGPLSLGFGLLQGDIRHTRAAGSSFIRFGQWPVSCIIPSRTALASNKGEKKTEWEELSGEKDGVNE